jgi:integrase
MAHIRKRGRRKDGSTIWQARMPDPSRPGGTAQIERTFRTKQEAEDWLTGQASGLLSGTYISPKQAERPFSDVLRAWEETWHTLSPTTAARYGQIVRKYLEPEFGARKIGAITPELVQRYVNRLSETHAPGTVRNVYAALRNACTRAVRMGIMRTNPAADIVLQSSSREPMQFLTAEEVSAVADAIAKNRTKANSRANGPLAVYLAAYTGLRAGEQWALQRQDVDLANARLYIRRARREVNGHITFGPTKTAGSRRTVTLPAFLVDMLREHMKTVPLQPDALIFTSARGLPVRHGLFVRRHWLPAVRRALPGRHIRWHDLRHTCASLLVNAGAHPLLVSKQLGHSSVTITLDRYSHLFPSVTEALAEQLDRAYAHAREAEPETADVVALAEFV